MVDSTLHQANFRIDALDSGKVELRIDVQGRPILAAHFSQEETVGLVARLLASTHEAQVVSGKPLPPLTLGSAETTPSCHVNAWQFGATKHHGQKAVVVRVGRAPLAFVVPDAEIRNLARTMISASSGSHSSLGSWSLLTRAVGDFFADLRGVSAVLGAHLSASSRRRATRFFSFVSGRAFRTFRIVKFAPSQRPPAYPDLNECIYCGETVYSKKPGVRRHPLGGEHIIAEGLGGTLELPLSSCQTCEEATGALVEGAVVGSTLKALRIQLGLKGKRKRPIPSKLPLVGSDGGKERLFEIDVGDYPIIFNMLIYDVPKVFKGEECKLPGLVGATAAVLQFDQRMMKTKYGITSFASPVWDNLMLSRMLAKIGFSFAVAELGKGLFSSTLPDLILNGKTEPMKFIGGETLPYPPTDAMHELRIGYQRILGTTHVVVKIRLFGAQGGPIYKVVIGPSLESPASRYKRVFSHRISSMVDR